MIEEWKREEDLFFIKTERSEYALQRLNENGCVVLTGGPGVGKTSILRYLARTFEKKGYRIIPVMIPEDIRTFYQPGKRSIFIVDDMCGKYTANQRDMDNWQQFSMVIKTILEDDSCKILLSCRLQVYLDERFKLLSPFQNCECNLMTKRLHKKEIMKMTKRYNISTKAVGMESRKYEYFPLLCSLYRENEGVAAIDFFKNPFLIYKIELDNLDVESFDRQCKLCGLALCVLFNNSIDEKWFQSKVVDNEKTMLQDTFGACGLNSGTSKDSIGKALRTLEGTYVCKQNGIYTILHDKLFDFLVYYFGQKMFQCLIEHGNCNLIRERFKWGKSNMCKSIEFITEIPDHYALKLFMDRLIKDWSEGKVSNMFHNINLQDSDFRVHFVHYLKQLDKNVQVKLANRKDTMFLEGDSSSGTYPIIDVCYHDYGDLLQWLLNNSVDVNKSRDDGVTPLIMASAYGIVNNVTMLLKQNPDVNLSNVENITALYIACQNSHGLVVEQLLKIEDINVDLCNNHGQSPLFIACQKHLTAIVNNLLQKSPNVNQCSRFGLNPLHIACFFCYTDIVSLLLAAKNVYINVNARDTDGNTPLVFACYKNYTEISSLLISAGADVNIKAFSGASALCFAIGHGNLETTSLLLKNNASLQTGFKNRQEIMDALSQNSERTLNEVQEEIRNFVDMNAPKKVRGYVSNMSGEYCLDAMIDSSPLHIACFMGHTNIVECLLNLEAYIDFTKEDGTTPLFFACELGHADIVRLLLDKRANVTIRRQDGKSALDIAEYNGHQSIAAMLMERAAN